MLTVSESGGLEWIVDWKDFDGNKKISEVKAKIFDTDTSLLAYVDIEHWANREMSEYIRTLNYCGTGTVFCLEELHDTWDDRTIVRLRNHLENLLPPDVAEDFKILFFDDTTQKDDAEIISANVDSFDYKIGFQIKGDNLNVQILRNEFDFRERSRQFTRKLVLIRKNSSFSRKTKTRNFPFKKFVGSKTVSVIFRERYIFIR